MPEKPELWGEPDYLGDALWVQVGSKGSLRVSPDRVNSKALTMTSVAVERLYEVGRTGRTRRDETISIGAI